MDKKILVVEDQEENIDALKLYIAQERLNPNDFVFARNYAQAKDIMDPAQGNSTEDSLKGIITDAFFPSGLEGIAGKESEDTELKSEVMTVLERSSYHIREKYFALEAAVQAKESLVPLGVKITKEAIEKRIPVVIATSFYHHATLFDPVYHWVVNRHNKHQRQVVTVIEGNEDCNFKIPAKTTAEYWDKALYELDKVEVRQ